jgi:hypothetical protein
MSATGTAVAGTKVAAAAAAAAEAGAPTAVAGLSAAAGGSIATVAAKVVAVAALALGVGTGGYALIANQARAPVVTVSEPAVTAAARAPTAPAAGPAMRAAPVVPAANVVSAPAPVPVDQGSVGRSEPPNRPAVARPLEPRPAVSPAPASAETFEAETRALRDALATLRDGQPERALAALDAQSSLYEQGALGEEREATRIDALCALGRNDEARAAATRFLGVHPRSLLAARVRASCAGAGSTP